MPRVTIHPIVKPIDHAAAYREFDRRAVKILYGQ